MHLQQQRPRYARIHLASIEQLFHRAFNKAVVRFFSEELKERIGPRV